MSVTRPPPTSISEVGSGTVGGGGAAGVAAPLTNGEPNRAPQPYNGIESRTVPPPSTLTPPV